MPSATLAAAARGLAAIVEANNGFGGGVVRRETVRGDLLYEGAWGTLANAVGIREEPMPMTPSTPFELASVTKMFTAAAILVLIGNGRLTSLSQPLATAAPRMLVRGGNGPAHWHNVTLRQLLQHTSGIQDYWQEPSFQRAFAADEGRVWKPAEVLEYAARMDPISEPPAAYHYSDTNFVLAGLVVEEAAGMALGDFFQEAIFAPLGMNSTYFSHAEDGNMGILT